MDTYVDPKRQRLDALAEHLKAHRFGVEPIMTGLLVRSPDAEILVTCWPNRSDERRLWFFDERKQQPLAEADRIPDAVVAIKGRLIPGGAGCGEA